jgi:hypothetical protein
MFERIKRTGDGGTAVSDRPETHGNGTTTTAAPLDRERAAGDERAIAHDRTHDAERTVSDERTIGHDRTHDAERMHAVRARQREEFGGINWGAAFFGWLVAIGLGALLVGLLAAAGAAVGLTDLSEADAAEIGLGGAIALLVALAVAYFAGGYVAGRMSRFDGSRQGFGTWLLGLVITVVLAVVGAVLGSEYNVLERLDLPAVPVGDSELATGGALALAIVVIGTLLAAVAGGKAGERYHRKVDRAGFVG